MHVLIAALHRPSKPTGVCRHAANLARCLADNDHITQVTLVTGAWQTYYFESSFSLTSDKIRILGIDIKNSSLSRNLWFLKGLPQLAHNLNSDIVHLSFPLPFLRSLFPCPVVATIHDLYPYEYPENFGYVQSLFNRCFLKACVSNSDGLSCVSKTTLEQLKYHFPSSQLQKSLAVIYNYVDFSNVNSTIPKTWEKVGNVPFLLCVGQHRKNKNLDLLIQAYALLLKAKQIHSSMQLLIVGSPGPETESLQALIQKQSLQNQVHLLSSLDDSELYWLYQNCKLFVIPSSTEGFCLPLAEALFLSCNVVCSDISTFREVGSSECVYFDLADNPLENLSDAMLKALSDRHQSMPNDNRFSKANIAEQYLNFYLKIMKSKQVARV